MAAGDIISVTILASGDRAEILIEGKTTGGTYDFGLGPEPETDPVPDLAKVIFTVISKQDDVGTPATISRTVHATKFLRKATPNQASADETVSGSDVIIRVWLSDYVYVKDKSGAGNSGTDPEVSISSGLYTQAGASNSVTGLTVTNNSTATYQQPIGNADWPPYQRFTGATARFRYHCFERHAQEGRPCRALKVTATDEGAHSTSVIGTEHTFEEGFGDEGGAVLSVIVDIPMSAFTQGNKLTTNFVGYPWAGDVLLDSSDGVNAVLSPNYCPQEHLCDKDGTYGVTKAKVSPSGVDATGQAYDAASYDYATAAPFLTIAKAARAIRNFNAARSPVRDDVGAGEIELAAGTYAWMGSTQAGGYGSTPKTWLTIKAGPGVARSDAIIGSASNDNDPGDRVKLENVKITSATAFTFDQSIAIWLHRCEIDSANTAMFTAANGRVWLTQCKITRLNQGLRPSSAVLTTCMPLVRGCDLTGFAHGILCYNVIGNKKTTLYAPSATLLFTEINGMTAPQPKGWTIAFNKIFGWRGDFQLLETGRYVGPQTHGGAIVQNIFENAHNGLDSALADVGSSDSVTTNTPLQNILSWHNTWVGQRVFFGYNDVGTIIKEKLYWSEVNDYLDRWACKTDTHTPANAARVGNWPVMNNVGSSGNYLSQNQQSVPGSFYAEFCGLDCHQPDGSSSGTAAEALFVDAKRYDGTTNGAGDGDYHTQESSPLRKFGVRIVLPYDLDSEARTAGFNDAGAFTSPDPSGGGNGGGGGGRGGKGGIRNGLSLRI